MNVIKHDFRGYDEINIYPIADVHIGSQHFKEKEFAEYVKMIEQDKRGYVLLNGDLINNAIKSSVSNIYDEKLNVEKSVDKIVDMLYNIRERILGVVSGNHEDRTYKEVGLDVSRIIAQRLGVEDLYASVSNVVFISLNKRVWVIYQTHGAGGGGTVGSKANKVTKLAQVVHADVYIHSHTHTPIIYKQDYMMTYGRNKTVKQVERLFINTNAYEGFGGYGEKLGLPPSNHKGIKITLNTNSVTATLM